MNMNMKNEKTMLALIVVAALAMVSVAGVALASDQSDAASGEINGVFVPTSDMEGTYYVVSLASSGSYSGFGGLVLGDDVNFTGTLNFATYYNEAYITYTSLTFDGASNIKILTEDIMGTVVITGDYDGTVGINAGTITSNVIGNLKISCGSNSIDIIDTTGITIMYGSTPIISGETLGNSIDSSIVVNGALYVRNFVNTVELIVPEGSTVTEAAPTYTISDAQTIMTFTKQYTPTATGQIYVVADTEGSHISNVTLDGVILTNKQYGCTSNSGEAGTLSLESGVLSGLSVGTHTAIVKYIAKEVTAVSPGTVTTRDVTYTETVNIAIAEGASTAKITSSTVTFKSQTLALTTSGSTCAGNILYNIPQTITTDVSVVASSTGTEGAVWATVGDLSISGGVLTVPLTAMTTTGGHYLTISIGNYRGVEYSYQADVGIAAGTGTNEGKTIYTFAQGYLSNPGVTIDGIASSNTISGTLTFGTIGIKKINSFLINGVDFTFATSVSSDAHGVDYNFGGFTVGATYYAYIEVTTTDGKTICETAKMTITNSTNIAFSSLVGTVSYNQPYTATVPYNGSFATGEKYSVGSVTSSATGVSAYGIFHENVLSLTVSGLENEKSAYLTVPVTYTDVNGKSVTETITYLATRATAAGIGDLTIGAVIGSFGATTAALLDGYSVYNFGTMDISGNLVFPEVKAISSGTILVKPFYNHGVMDVNGKITITFSDKTTVTTGKGTIEAVINAAMYSTTTTTDTVTGTTTYYYTTLKNALANSYNITVLGNVTITDAEFTLQGADATKDLTINLGIASTNKGNLTIGNSESTSITTAVKDKITLAFNNGDLMISNGKFVVYGLIADDYSSADVIADVFTTDGTNGTYTDLATALSEAIADDTITLRQDADIIKDAELIEDVTLDGKYYFDVTIDAGVTFTVNGKITDVGTILVKTDAEDGDGKLIINNDDVKYQTLTVCGILDIEADSSDWSLVISAESADAKNAQIIIGGDFTTTADIRMDGKKSLLTVNGTLNGSAIHAVSAVVSGNMKTTGAVQIEYLTVTGTYTNEGTIETQVLKVSGTFNNGTSVNGVTLTVDNSEMASPEKYPSVISGTFNNGTSTTTATFNVDYLDLTGSLINGKNCGITVDEVIYVGTVPDELEYTNDASVSSDGTILGTNAYAVVYGDLDVGKAFGETPVYTNYMLNTDNLYATVYSGEIAQVLINITPNLKGYVFQSNWYTDVAMKTTPIAFTNGVSTIVIGDYENIYGAIVVKTVSVTVNPLVNGHWVINGNVITSGSDVPLKESDNSIEFVADSTYKIDGDTTILVNGSAMPLGYQPTAGDELSVTANIVKDESVGGMDLVTMLLIVITIVIVIMAIIIALKLMRS